jgi:hypothetical protein
MQSIPILKALALPCCGKRDWSFPSSIIQQRPFRRRVRLHMSLLAALIVGSAILSSPCQADSIDISQMKSAMNSGFCPSQLNEVEPLTFEQHCGQNYMSTMSISEISQCQSETIGMNNTITKYNDFIRRCREIGNVK